MKLRDYQRELLDAILASSTNDLVQLDTGGGKTAIEAELAKQAKHCLIIAHRNILIAQISAQLACFKIHHDTISSKYTRKQCARGHTQHGVHILSGATTLVCSIDTLISHHKHNRLTLDKYTEWLIIIDEAHHVVAENKWGGLRNLFAKARIIGFTATPARLDCKSLSTKHGGLFNRLVQAESLKNNSVRTLIQRGYLSDFRVYAPEDKQAKKTRDGMTIFGNPVTTYKRLAWGKRAVMMCPSILNAQEFAREFKKSGVTAAYISSNQSATEITRVLTHFARGDINVMCNVDMLGEGFDMPEIECLIIANTTQSLVRYRQWVGRVLRVSKDKKQALVIDHVGVVAQHGMPDEPILWDIEAKNMGISALTHVPCRTCGLYFLSTLLNCPGCNDENTYSSRSLVGDYYVDLKKIDFTLLERARKEKKLSEELIYVGAQSCGAVGVSADKLRAWFITGLQSMNVSIRGINRFLSSGEYYTQSFWLNNFKLRDLERNNSARLKKVYKHWLKTTKTTIL